MAQPRIRTRHYGQLRRMHVTIRRIEGAKVDDLDVVAFLDESRKPMRDPQSGRPVASELHYAVAAALLLRGDLESLRADLVSIAHNVGGSLHYADLGRERRIAALTALGELDGWEGLIYETAAPLSHRIPERRPVHACSEWRSPTSLTAMRCTRSRWRHGRHRRGASASLISMTTPRGSLLWTEVSFPGSVS